MEQEELLFLWCNYNDVNFAKIERFLLKFDKICDVFDEKLLKNAVFSDEELKNLKQKLLNEDFEKFKQKVEDDLYKYNLKFVTFVSIGYPEKLKSIDEPPVVLFFKGDVSLFNKKSISIVGTRKPTIYGKIVCENFTKELSSSGLVTVSGLAYGIDTIVAENTLESGGKTIAVLAGGLDSIYPAQNTELAKRIVEKGGLIVSENHVGVRPLNYFFVNRNRIVSGLGLGTLIVEAGENSGTMTTAKFAIEQSRELFVVPGNINSVQSVGTNQLIDQMPDTFTISPKRILMKLNIKPASVAKSAVQVDLVQSKVLDALSAEEISFDDLSDKTGIKASELSSILIKMEMFGLVKKGDGNTYYKM